LTDLLRFPGGDLVSKGLSDLQSNNITVEALLVLVAKTKLRDLGLNVPQNADIVTPYEHRLYEAIEARNQDGAHAEYNALLQRLVSFAQAYGRANSK
jgi:hypothetical protein